MQKIYEDVFEDLVAAFFATWSKPLKRIAARKQALKMFTGIWVF